MAEQLVIESPDFDQIRDEAGQSTEDSIRLLWFTLNEEILARRKQRFRWEDVAYADVTFSASAGTWTVGSDDFDTYKYVKFGDFLVVEYNFINTSTSAGMGNELRFTLPKGLEATSAGFIGPNQAFGNIDEAGYVVTRASPNQNLLSIQRTGATNWPSSVTNDLTVRGMIILQVT